MVSEHNRSRVYPTGYFEKQKIKYRLNSGSQVFRELFLEEDLNSLMEGCLSNAAPLLLLMLLLKNFNFKSYILICMHVYT